jgi:hypothetical protein
MEIIFHNNLDNNSVDVTIEAPIGNCTDKKNVGPSQTATLTGGENCLSVRIKADVPGEPEHSATQDFVLASPEKGRESYLFSATVEFYAGDILGGITAKTVNVGFPSTGQVTTVNR